MALESVCSPTRLRCDIQTRVLSHAIYISFCVAVWETEGGFTDDPMLCAHARAIFKHPAGSWILHGSVAHTSHITIALTIDFITFGAFLL